MRFTEKIGHGRFVKTVKLTSNSSKLSKCRKPSGNMQSMEHDLRLRTSESFQIL